MLIETDRRRLDVEPDEDAARLAREIAGEYLDLRVRFARVLHRIEASKSYVLDGCSSGVQFAQRLGVPAAEARLLLDLGRTLEAPPAAVAPPVDTPPAVSDDGTPPTVSAEAATVEERVRSGRLPVENAALVGKLLAEPGLIRPGEDWMARAEALPTPALRRAVGERIEQAAQGEPTLVPLSLHVTAQVRDDFHRARALASRDAQMALTEGQTFTVLVRDYLRNRDRRAVGTRSRRVGPTSETPQDRYVPAAVQRAVVDRADDRCEVAGCTHDTFLQFAHRTPHADGSGREAEDLFLLCTAHHTQYDAGLVVFAEWRDGRPAFRTARGAEIGPSSAFATSTSTDGGDDGDDIGAVPRSYDDGRSRADAWRVCESVAPWGAEPAWTVAVSPHGPE